MDYWVFDLKASFHTTNHYNVIENNIARNYRKVYLTNSEPLDIVGIRDVNMEMSNRHMRKINKVRHVPKLMLNLILVGQLDSKGYKVSFKNGS